MPSTRSSAVFNVPLTTYAQGIMQDKLALYRLANLLCPIVQVGAAVGTFKIFDDRNAFLPQDTARALTGPRRRIAQDATDGTYACKPHGIEVGVDDFEADLAGGQNPVAAQLLEQGKLRSLLSQKATSYVKRVTDFVFANLTPVADRGQWTNPAVDPIDQIDEQLEQLSVLAGSTENINVVMSVTTWAKVRRNEAVKKRCNGVQVEAITREQFVSGLLFPCTLEISAASYVATKRGQTATSPGIAKTTLMQNYVIVANSLPGATTEDPSPFKCFSTSSVLVDAIKTYREEQNNSDIHAMDWSEDIKACGTALARMLSIT